MSHLLREKPPAEIAERFKVSPELLFPDLRLLAVGVNKDAGGHRILVDIDAATAGI
jgi:hypothetical protein